LSTLAIIAATMEKIAIEIRHLQRTEVREAEEPFGGEQRGSSAMPHKRNPVTCEQVSGLARLVRSNMIAGFVNRPPFVLVNREPLTNGPTTATVVDGETYRLPTMLHNRDSIIEGMAALGYEMLGSWQIPERSVIIPCYPDRSALEYSGMFFRLKPMEVA